MKKVEEKRKHALVKQEELLKSKHVSSRRKEILFRNCDFLLGFA